MPLLTTAVDNGDHIHQQSNDQDDQDDEEQAEGEEGSTSEPVRRPKLPSFKKRQRESEDGPSEKIDLSEEIRLQKEKRARTEVDEEGELEEQGEVDPQQGTACSFYFSCMCFASHLITPHISFAGRTG